MDRWIDDRRIDGLIDGWAGAEQVEMKMLSVNLSGGCLPQVRPERRSRMTLSWRQTPGSQCQSNLQTENTTLKKPWIWLYWITDLTCARTHTHTHTHTHTPTTEKPRASQTGRKWCRTAAFPHMCLWHFNICIQWLEVFAADTHVQSLKPVYTAVHFSVSVDGVTLNGLNLQRLSRKLSRRSSM